MSHYFTTELGRMRTEEAIARADRYRLAQQSRREKSGRESKRLSWSSSFVYRRALAAFGLSALMVLGFAALAFASPMGPGESGDGVANDITASKHHPQVKGANPGQPVRSQHTYGYTTPSTTVAGLRAENFVQRFGYYPGAAGVAGTTGHTSVAEAPNTDAISDLRALNEPAGVGTPLDAIADLRALNSPSIPSVVRTDAIADLRALNVPSLPSQVRADVVAQLRALNEPSYGAQVASVEAPEGLSDGFPLVQSLAIITGILVLIAGGLMVATRSQQSPKTV